jgi:hypothetical protein
LSFPANTVTAEVLKIELLPCLDPECPGGGDGNPILSALEVTSSPNRAPTARIVASASEVTLMAGTAEVMLDGSTSDDGDGGTQGLSYEWSKLAGPALDAIESPLAAVTRVTFTQAGDYRYQLFVNDGQPVDNTDTETVDITVLEGGPRLVRSDADSSGSIDLSDGIVVLLYLFSGGGVPECLDAADSNDTGVVDVSSAVRIFNWLFLGGMAPLPPSPSTPEYPASDCGLDPTDDGLDCAIVSATCS